MIHDIDTDELHEAIAAAVTEAGTSRSSDIRARIDGAHVQLARQFATCCDGNSNGPHWDWIDRGEVRGGCGGMCGACGSYGVGWVTCRAEITDPATIADTIDALYAELDGRWSKAAAADRPGTLDRLRSDLDMVVRWIGAGVDVDDWQTGSETRPGVYRDGDVIVSWDYVAGEWGDEVVDVTTPYPGR